MNILFCLVAVACAYTPLEYEALYDKFLTDHNKLYDGDEAFYRFKVFKTNIDHIDEHNNGSHCWTLSRNKFSDITEAEFSRIYLGNIRIPKHSVSAVKSCLGDNIHRPEPVVAVESGPHADVDWRGTGALSPIIDQGQCACCWAIATSAAVEAAEFIKTQVLTPLSKQALMDCSGPYGNHGCNGGHFYNAFNFIKAKGIPTETSYPFTGGKVGHCKSYTISTKISKMKHTHNLETDVAKQPLSVAVDARKWQHYSRGTFCCKEERISLNHAVLLVGSYSDYWIIKNSWGTDWGIGGFMHLSKTYDCGITQDAFYPTI